MNPPALTLHEAADLLRQRELSSKELTAAVFDRIAATDDKVHSYITLCRDSALEQAKAADERLKQAQNSHTLLGIPLAIKDNFFTLGIRTTCASKITADFIPPYYCSVASRIRVSGARIAGHDAADSTSINRPVPPYSEGLTGDIKGLRLGIPKEYFVSGMQPEVEQALRQAVRLLEQNGAVIEEISLPHTEYAIAVYYIVATAEASSNLARYDGMRYGYRARGKDLTETYMLSRQEGFGPEVNRRIMLGTYVLSAGYYDAYYLKAQQVRALIKKDFEEAFQRVDAIITPTAPTTAFKIGEKTQDPLQMYLSDIYTISINLAGLPALSLPCGFDSDALPIGMQIIGKHFAESTILGVAYSYEQSTDWHNRKPKL